MNVSMTKQRRLWEFEVVVEVFNSQVIIMLLELVFLILASCWIGESKRRNVLLIIGELTFTFLDQIVAVFKTSKLLKFTEQ